MALAVGCHVDDLGPSSPGTPTPPATSSPSRPLSTLPPTLPRSAEAAWQQAESANTAEAWDVAAAAYAADLETCHANCRDAARSAILARKNALTAEPEPIPAGDQPIQVPPRTAAMIAALDRFVAVADPADPEIPGMRFLAAAALGRCRQPDAIPRFELILRTHPDHETVEYSANLLLDRLNTLGQTAELGRWVDTLLAMPQITRYPDLYETLQRLRARRSQ